MHILLKVFFIIITLISSAASAAEQKWEMGKPYPARITVCDTVEQILDIVRTHQDEGFEAASGRFRMYNSIRNELGEPVCGEIQGIVRIVEVVGRFENLEKLGSIYVVKVEIGGTIYATTWGDTIVPTQADGVDI